MNKTNIAGSITISAPKGALCGLFSDVPSSMEYFKAIDQKNAIAPTKVTDSQKTTLYYYEGLAEGIYHYAVSMQGYTAVCQIVNYTKEKAESGIRIDVELNALLGNGYESGYVMLNTAEFIEANLASDKSAWGEEYAHLFNTPQFTRSDKFPGRHQQTTNEEIYEFIKRLSEKNKNMYVFSLGKTPKYKFDMPLVLFTQNDVSGKSLEETAEIIRANGKPTVQYIAQVHSNEPASTEGALAMMLSLTDEFGSRVLNSTDVYIIPRINLDGAVEVIRQSPTTNEDMNRDYLFMNNKELRMVNSAYNLFLPEVAIDGHERRTEFLNKGDGRAADMELQVGAGSLNHPAIMTETAMKIALTAIHKAKELGLRTHFYTYLASAAGGSAGSSYYGTRNSLSFLVETPGGTTLGNFCMARRVLAQYVLASTAIAYTAENAEEIINTVHSSRKKMIEMGSIYDEANLMVLEHEKAPSQLLSTDFINVPTGIKTQTKDVAYDEHTVALRARPRATAYVIPMGLKNEQKILDMLACHAVPHYTIPKSSAVKLRRYVRREDGIDIAAEELTVFENGAYVFPNTVPSTVLSVVMEPDFNSASKRRMSLFSMGLIDFDKEGRLPVYRYCHDLSSGRISLED